MSRYNTIITDELKIAEGTIFLYMRALFCFEENVTNLNVPVPQQNAPDLIPLEILKKMITPVGNQKINILSIKGTCSANELGLSPATIDFTNLPGPLNLTKAIERADRCYAAIDAFKGEPAFNGKFGLRPKNDIVQAFDPAELAILRLGDGGLNGYRTRSVEVRFSKVITLPPGNGADSTTQFRLNIGDETPGLHSLLPFTTFSSATLTMEDDGASSIPKTFFTVNYDVTTFSFGVGVGVGYIAKAFKNIKASQKALGSAVPGIFEEFVDPSLIVANEIPKSVKDKVLTELMKTVRELLKEEITNIASIELDTNTADPVFFTEVPFSKDDLKEFCIVALEGSFAVPMSPLNFSVAFTVGFALLPMVPFADFSVSLIVGASTSVAEAELKIIKLTQIP
jgi:hypothetical protein